MNNKPINYKKKKKKNGFSIISNTEKKLSKQIWNFFDFRSDTELDSDPLFPDPDPRQNEAGPKQCFLYQRALDRHCRIIPSKLLSSRLK